MYRFDVPLTEVEIADACREWALKKGKLPPGKWKAGTVNLTFTAPTPPSNEQSFAARVSVESVD